MAWVSPILWPFLRVLALFSTAPVFSMRAIPTRAKVALAFLVALCAQASLGDMPVIDLNSRAATARGSSKASASSLLPLSTSTTS